MTMTTGSADAENGSRTAGFVDRQPVGWITTVADQIALEVGLQLTADIEDLVIMTYLGLLDSPDPAALSRRQLLSRSRRNLVTWAWEQGAHQQTLPTSVHHRAS